MLDSFSPGFAVKFGLRNALIMSGICAAARVSEEGMSSRELRERFFYLSKDQIRKALAALVKAEMLTAAKSGGGFTRELRYAAVDRAVHEYLLDLTDPGIYVKLKSRRQEG
jgi:hypothetical protein